jgi:cyclohexanone monooxygenase
MPKERYSYQPEIFSYVQTIARKYDLHDRALFQTKVTELRWLENEKRWQVRTDRNDDIKARFVTLATGSFSAPKLPGIPGIEDFTGHLFHTCRWDYSYTGGDHSGNLHNLADKHVAVIGTGATAIQCVPRVAVYAKHTYVLQRTPSSVDERSNRPTDPAWWNEFTKQPGWQRKRRNNFNDVVAGVPVGEDLVGDGWTAIFRQLDTIMPREESRDAGTPEQAARAAQLAEIADFTQMNRVRDRVSALVHDHETADKLKPWYAQFCKRPTFNDEYLTTFNRPNVDLIDTSSQHGVERITENGFISHGNEYPVDCIIMSTGFDVRGLYTVRAGFEIFGEGGQSFSSYAATGDRTLHGMSFHGFPNLFYTGIGQGGVSVNVASTLEDQTLHITYLINEVLKRGKKSIQPTCEAVDAWVDEIRALSGPMRDFLSTCTPGYYNGEGKFYRDGLGFGGDQYGKGANAFDRLIAQWREDGTMSGMVLE